MKKLKYLLLTMMLAMFMAQPAMADVLDKDDMAFAFGSSPASSGFGEIALLSHQEMMETEGALLWFSPVVFHGARFALRGFTRHGLNQVISRNGVGVSNRAILNTLRNPLPGSRSFITGRNANTTRFIGQNATVTINRGGHITSAWARNSFGWR